jgi:rSAM/selenodomain-associated transferase 2/rSAM/selenodomain-associated transferase 1
VSATAILFLKAPRAGFVKTRLGRDAGAEKALAVYRELAELQWRRIPSSWRTEIHFAPADAESEMRQWLGDRGFFRPQVEADLGGRLASGFTSAFRDGGAPVIALGGDCPELDAACLERARLALERADIVLGPATDGGYYLIGLNRETPGLFENIPWSTSAVLAATLTRAAALGLRVSLLEVKSDIDDATDWADYRRRRVPPITVLIPALNEGLQIDQTIRAVMSALPTARVLVVDGGSSDQTVAVAKAMGADVVSSSRGRGVQLAAGAALAHTEWLLFLHADTILPEAASEVIAKFATKRDAHIATFRLKFDQPGWFLRAGCWFTRFDSVFTRFGDQGILVRRTFYESVGGFRDWPLFEDVEFLQRARRQTKIHSLPADVITSARRFRARGIYRQQWLNACLVLRYLCGASPEKLAAIYRSGSPAQAGATAPTVDVTSAPIRP